jgi:hypothetical protein
VARAAIGVQQQHQNPPFSPPELHSPDFNYFHGYSSSPSFSSLPPTPLWELQLRSGGEKGQHFTFPDDSQQQPPEENDIDKGEQRSNNEWKELFSPTATTHNNVDEEGRVDDTSISCHLQPTASSQSTFPFGPLYILG